MPEFKGFLSYARKDAEADPRLITALTSELQNRVNLKFANDRFVIWRDEDRIRLADKWEDKIKAELRSADILIVLLTPSWLGSEFCLKEYEIFQQVEAQLGDDDHTASYVAPIIAQEFDDKSLSEQQRGVNQAIRMRQYQRLLAADFLTLKKPLRTKMLDEIADDIHGILERRRNARPNLSAPPRSIRTDRSTKREFSVRAYNYAEVDYVSNAEVLLDRRTTASSSSICAQVGFVERLYVEGEAGRIEFGGRRAYLKLANEGPGKVFKVDELKHTHRQNVSYKTLQDAPDAICLFIDPPFEKSSQTGIIII